MSDIKRDGMISLRSREARGTYAREYIGEILGDPFKHERKIPHRREENDRDTLEKPNRARRESHSFCFREARAEVDVGRSPARKKKKRLLAYPVRFAAAETFARGAFLCKEEKRTYMVCIWFARTLNRVCEQEIEKARRLPD